MSKNKLPFERVRLHLRKDDLINTQIIAERLKLEIRQRIKALKIDEKNLLVRMIGARRNNLSGQIYISTKNSHSGVFCGTVEVLGTGSLADDAMRYQPENDKSLELVIYDARKMISLLETEDLTDFYGFKDTRDPLKAVLFSLIFRYPGSTADIGDTPEDLNDRECGLDAVDQRFEEGDGIQLNVENALDKMDEERR